MKISRPFFNVQNYFVKQALIHLTYSPWLLCVCLPVCACPSLSLLTAPLNQLMRCLRKYQSRTPSPLLPSVPSDIVFDFEPGPVFRGSWALLSCFHPKQTKYKLQMLFVLTLTACVCQRECSVLDFGLAWLECSECASHPYSPATSFLYAVCRRFQKASKIWAEISIIFFVTLLLCGLDNVLSSVGGTK